MRTLFSLSPIVPALVALALSSSPPLAAQDGELGLHSEGGAWRFYPAATGESGLPRILLIGDSIMNGYRGRVVAGLEWRARVDCWLTPLHLKSEALHDDLRLVLEQGPYDLVHFNIGLHGWPPGRIPEGEYEPALRAYVELLRAGAREARLIWASTTPMTVEGKPTELEPEHNPTITGRNAIAARVMAELGIDINDLYGLVVDHLELGRGDRFHWEAAGYELMANEVLKHVAAALPDPAPPTVTWTSPSEDSRGSMPIGNGDVGANVWVEANGDLLFLLSKTDAWSENCRLLKLGRVRVTCDPPLRASGEGVVFRQTLDPYDGVLRVSSSDHSGKIELLLRIDANHPVVHVEITSDLARSLTASFETWRSERRELTGQEKHSAYGMMGADGPPAPVEPDHVVPDRTDRVIWYHRNETSLWKTNLELQALGEQAKQLTDPLLHRTFGGLMRGEGLRNTSPARLVAESPRERFGLRIVALTDRTPSSESWIEAIERLDAEIPSAREALAAHVEWWHEFWHRSWIVVTGDADAERISRAYALQRWVNACGGRGNSPIKFNGSIFTVEGSDKGQWDADYRRWGGPYWWQNTRLPYWGMLASGDLDLMQPLFRMFLDALPLRRAATRAYYGHEGAFYPETQYFWGTYADSNYGRDRSELPDGMTENRYIRYYWQGGLELALMMLDTHAHGGDDSFANAALLPLASEVLTFFDQHWERDAGGVIRFEPAMALETYRVAVNPLVEIVAIRKVCEGMLALPERLTTQAQREQWTRLIGELPPVPTRTVEGQELLAPAEVYREKQNQENPELYAIFPYRVYGVEKPNLELARRTFAARGHKGTGGWQQNAIQAARLGLAEDARRMVAENAARVASGFRFPTMWGPNFDWIPDQDHGSVMMLALQQMILQSDPPAETLWLLPAWPEAWDVVFKLHAPGETVLRGRYRGGRLEELVVSPPAREADVHRLPRDEQ